MKRDLFLPVAALLLAAGLLLSACGKAAEAATIFLRKTEGTVHVQNDSGRDVQPAEDLGLYSGYGVNTEAQSYAWIDLDSVKLTKLDENSEAEILKEGRHLTVEVRSGSLFFNVTEPLADDETMEIRSSTMVVGIRGTRGWVSVSENGDTMRLWLLEGTVRCTAGGTEETVQAGETAILYETGGILVSSFAPTEIPAFVRDEFAGERAVIHIADGNLSWGLSEDGVLTISGTGDMPDWGHNAAPWYGSNALIRAVVIEDGVTGIGACAFENCLSLTSVTISDGVTRIGDFAFSYCEELADAALPGSVTDIGEEAFARSGLTAVDLPNSVAHIGKNAFYSCDALASLVLPNGLADIEEGAFAYCDSLTSVTLPDGLVHIADGLFQGCTALASVTLPDGLASIGSFAFAGCGLTAIDFPDSIQEIGTSAFGTCTSLTSVTFPEGLAGIGESAFWGCGFTFFDIPASVTSIGNSVFYACGSLRDIYFAGTQEEFEAAVGSNHLSTDANLHYGSHSGDSGQGGSTLNLDAATKQTILEQYRAIVAQAGSYTYDVWPANANEGYAYALYQEDGYAVPTLILRKLGLDRHGYLLFRYDPDTGTTPQVGTDSITKFEFPSHDFINGISYDSWYPLTDTGPLESRFR